MFDLPAVDHRGSARELPANQFNRELRAEHNLRGLGVDPEVIFGCRGHIAFAAGCAAHDHAPAYVGRQLRRLTEGQRQVRERSEGDQFYPRIGFDDAHHRVHCGAVFGGARGRLIAVIAQAILPVKPGGILERAH